MAAVRPACASLLFIAMAIFALAAVAKGAGEPDPDPERVGGNPMDCPLECSSKLTGYIMETIKCYVACMGGGGGGGGELSAAEERSMRRPSCVEHVVVVSTAGWGDSLVTITACIQARRSGAPSDKILQ